ncbi:hypothetical protein [Paraburkholderia caledonica]|uniref:hypothetical protein n=1 Tax=Paraburkholderia caledonica TaxID=134536 RepID=UPI000484FB7A|nr:hypothetical protein [Paraburkholderia caledonica]
MQIPNDSLREFVTGLAKQHGVRYTTFDRVFDRVFRREVGWDDTERMIVALRRRNVIDGATMTTLMARYFAELAAKRTPLMK